MTRPAQHEHAERVGEAAAVVERGEELDGALVERAGGVLLAGDVIRHRQQVHRFGDPPLIAGALEDRQRLVVVRDALLRALAIDVPVPDAVQAVRDQRRIVDLPRHDERVLAKAAGPLVIARRPEHPQRVERAPFRTTVAGGARRVERGGEVLVRGGEGAEDLVRASAGEEERCIGGRATLLGGDDGALEMPIASVNEWKSRRRSCSGSSVGRGVVSTKIERSSGKSVTSSVAAGAK